MRPDKGRGDKGGEEATGDEENRMKRRLDKQEQMVIQAYKDILLSFISLNSLLVQCCYI